MSCRILCTLERGAKRRADFFSLVVHGGSLLHRPVMVILFLTALFVLALFLTWHRCWWLVLVVSALALVTGDLLDSAVVWLVNVLNLMIDTVIL